MAIKKEEPAKGTKPSHPEAVDGAGEDEQWHSIELPDPDADWEKVYTSHANLHSIDYYKDEGLVEMPIEDDWTSVTHIPEEPQKEQKREKIRSTYHPGERIKRRLARERNVRTESQQTAAQDSAKDDAAAANARTSRFRNDVSPGGIANRRAPGPGKTYAKTLDEWVNHAFFYPPFF